jgi:hypothetical protein
MSAKLIRLIQNPGMYKYRSRGIESTVTAGTDGWMETICTTSVCQSSQWGLRSLPNTTMLMVSGAISGCGTGVGTFVVSARGSGTGVRTGASSENTTSVGSGVGVSEGTGVGLGTVVAVGSGVGACEGAGVAAEGVAVRVAGTVVGCGADAAESPDDEDWVGESVGAATVGVTFVVAVGVSVGSANAVAVLQAAESRGRHAKARAHTTGAPRPALPSLMSLVLVGADCTSHIAFDGAVA